MADANSSPYFNLNYDSKKRFCSYWHQINEICEVEPTSVLEIGAGSCFVRDYLIKRNIEVTTFDINKEVDPDVVGTVVDIPFEENSFSVVSCCEVLEHLPFSDFSRALDQIKRVADKRVVISLPDRSKVYHLACRIPFFGPVKWLIPFPRLDPTVKAKKSRVHEWEIGIKGFPLKRIRDAMQEEGFTIENTYRVFENPRHRFFILTDKDS